MEPSQAYVAIVPGEEPVTWRDVDTPTTHLRGNPDPFGAAYRADPVILQEDLDGYRSGAYEYPLRPTSRFDDVDYYDPTAPHRYSKYSSGSTSYMRPSSSYDDSYSGYYSGGRSDYSPRGYDYRGAPSRSRLDYDPYGGRANPTSVTRDGYIGGPEFSQRTDYVSNGFLNPGEYARQRDYVEGYLSPSSDFSRHHHYRPYRSYDAYRYR